MAEPVTVTLSSVGTSRPVNLDWLSGAKLAFTITGSSSGTFSVTPEGTINDLQLSSSPSWVALSSAALTTNTSVGGYRADGRYQNERGRNIERHTDVERPSGPRLLICAVASLPTGRLTRHGPTPARFWRFLGTAISARRCTTPTLNAAGRRERPFSVT
jgi:hypothetical protein